MKSSWIRITGVFGAVLLTILSLNQTHAPFVWIDLIWGAWCVLVAYFSMGVGVRVIAACLCAVMVACSGVELYSDLVERPGKHVFHDSLVLKSDEQLGRTLWPDRVVTHRTSVQGKVINEALYTIEANGLRLTSESSKTSISQPCILFFGDSFTFGAGVFDDETMPYQVRTKSQATYWTVNFGVPGYGPHQMLRALELGYVENLVHCPVHAVIYQVIPDHVARAVGLLSWSDEDPFYRYDERGYLAYAGRFGEAPSRDLFGIVRRVVERLPSVLQEAVKKSQIVQNVISRHRKPTPRDIDTFAAIVSGARDNARVKFPDAEFHVLLWDYREDENVTLIRRALDRHQLSLHLVSSFLRLLHSARCTYELHPLDQHPNPIAYSGMATYVVAEILHLTPVHNEPRSRTVPLISACTSEKIG